MMATAAADGGSRLALPRMLQIRREVIHADTFGRSDNFWQILGRSSYRFEYFVATMWQYLWLCPSEMYSAVMCVMLRTWLK